MLWVDYAYDTEPEWRRLNPQRRKAWLFADSLAAFRAASNQGSYSRISLIGKSLGTLAVGGLISKVPSPHVPRIVWLTPVLTDPGLREQILGTSNPSFVVIGSADRLYDEAFLRLLGKKPGIEILVLPNADHSLEVESSIAESIKVLGQVTESIGRFVMG